MQIIRNINHYSKIAENLQNSVLTLGNFDGVHLGHQKILDEVKKIAKKHKTSSALISFYPHPISFLKKIKNINIFDIKNKILLLKKEKIDLFFLIRFSKEIANLSAEDFVEEILIKKMQVKHIVIGYDFIFGKDRKGDYRMLQKYAKKECFRLSKINKQSDDDHHSFSSTAIRKFLEKGEIVVANKYLGKKFFVCGKVILGKKFGAKIGFATANILWPQDICQIKIGVFVVKITILNDRENVYYGVANYGQRPTINDDKKLLLETYIFDFEQNIYGQKIKIEFLDFIRKEKKFNSIKELAKQISKDIIYAKKTIALYSK